MRRLEELDSLRGLAALTVVIYHLFLMLSLFDSLSPHNFVERMLISTPLSILWGGHQAVILFFVLSGFVLSLPFYKADVPYLGFIIKRACRIYLPYFAAILLALLLRSIITHTVVQNLSGYFNRQWTTPITWGNFISHIVMIGPQFNSDTLDSPMWSLIHEMRISLVFPILMILVKRFGWKFNIFIGVLLSMIGVACQLIYHATYQPVYKTLPYILMFIVGALLAKYFPSIKDKISSLRITTKVCIFIAGLLFYENSDWILRGHLLQLKAFDDIETLIGATILISAALSWNGFSVVLKLRPIRFLGKISYSLYLFHAIVLLSVTYLLHDLVPLWMIWVIILVASILLSTITYHFIERPSMKLGRNLASRVSSKRISTGQIPSHDSGLV